MTRRRTVLAFLLCVFALGGAAWVAWETRWSWAYVLESEFVCEGSADQRFPEIVAGDGSVANFVARFSWVGPYRYTRWADSEGVVMARSELHENPSRGVVYYSASVSKYSATAHRTFLGSYTRGPDLP